MNLATRITILRMLLVPFFMGCLLYWTRERSYLRYAAASCFTFACLADAVDGILARHLNQKTRLGALMDPLADKALLIAAYLGLTLIPNLPDETRVPVWLTLVVISRDLLILAGVWLIYAAQKDFERGRIFWANARPPSKCCSSLFCCGASPPNRAESWRRRPE